MHDPSHEQQWEVRMAYYDRLLRNVMETLEGTVRIMKVDGLSKAVEDLGKALLAIEDAWATLTLEWTSSLVASEERYSQKEPAQSRDTEGGTR